MTDYTPEKVAELAERTKRMRKWQQMEADDFLASDLEAVLTAAEDLTAVSAERDRAKSGAKTLGEIVERQVEDTLRWAGMEDQIGMDDPDQQLAWELCAEMPGKIATLQADSDRLHKAITEALDHDPLHGRSEGLHCGGMSPCIRGILRAALDKEGNDDE